MPNALQWLMREGRALADLVEIGRIKYNFVPRLGRAMRLLDLLRRPKVAVEIAGDVLVVTMSGTTFGRKR